MDPVATIKRIIETLTFRRPVYVWMQFEPNATGDAIVIVALTTVALSLLAGARFTFTGAVSIAISALFSWLIIAGLTWAAAKFVFDASGDYAPVLRVAGFAFPATLLLLVTVRLFPNVFGLLLGYVWFVVALGAGTQEVLDMKREHAVASAAMGFIGWLLLQALLSRGGGFY